MRSLNPPYGLYFLLPFFLVLLSTPILKGDEGFHGILYVCIKCKRDYPKNGFCEDDGQALKRYDLRPFCRSCRVRLPENANFCPWDGLALVKLKFFKDSERACEHTLKALFNAAKAYGVKHGRFPVAKKNTSSDVLLRAMVEEGFFDLSDVALSLEKVLRHVDGFQLDLDCGSLSGQQATTPRPVLWHTQAHSDGQFHVLYSNGSLKVLDKQGFADLMDLISRLRGQNNTDTRPFCPQCKFRCPKTAKYCPWHGRALRKVLGEKKTTTWGPREAQSTLSKLFMKVAAAQKSFAKMKSKQRFGTLKELKQAGLLDSNILDTVRGRYALELVPSPTNPKTVYWLIARPLSFSKDPPYFFMNQHAELWTLKERPKIDPASGEISK
jgi:hypothetical protein